MSPRHNTSNSNGDGDVSTPLSAFLLADVERLEIPEVTIGGRPVVLWIQHSTAGDIIDMLDFDPSLSDAEKSKLQQARMFELLPRCIVNSPSDRTLAFGNATADEIKRALPALVWQAIMTKINEMSGFGAKDKGAESGNPTSAASETATTDDSSTASLSQ